MTFVVWFKELREKKHVLAENYGYDEDFEMYTGLVYSEWTLRISRVNRI